MRENENLQQLRTQAQQIAERIRQDPSYTDEIKRDPVGTLSAFGIPQHVIDDLVAQKTQEADVSGYRYVDDVCNDGTCWSSNCPECCSITF
jgi:hypothetical protein